MKVKEPDNDRWIRDNFAMIVSKYGGKVPYILVAGGKIFPVRRGENIRDKERKISRKYGKTTGMPVPSGEDFHSVLGSTCG